MRFKVGVKLDDLKPQTVLALVVCNEVYRDHGEQMTVTSVNDGMHMTGSLHDDGKAFDLRTKSIDSDKTKRSIVNKITHRLARLGFDVVFEAVGDPNEHLHVEYDPK